MKKKVRIISTILSIILVLYFVGCGSKDKEDDKDDVTVSDNNKNDEVDVNKDKPKEDVKNDKVDKPKEEIKTEEVIKASVFGVNGNLTLTFTGQGSYSQKWLVKGDGKKFQIIKEAGIGAVVDVYEVKDTGLTHVLYSALSDEESKDLSKVDYLSKESNKNDIMIKSPIKKGTRWDNKEIVETGKDLVVNGKTLKGKYVKTWQKEDYNGAKFITTYWFVEGIGIVRYSKQLDGVVMEEASLKSIENLIK